MDKINLAIVGLGQIGNYLLNELNNIEHKTEKILCDFSKNIKKKS